MPIKTNPNKANSQKAKMNVNSLITKDYRKNDDFAVPKNKPNTNPIPRKARMDVSLAITRNYNNEQRTMNNELLFKTNPIKPNFKLFAGDVIRRKLLFLTVYPIRGSLYLREVEMVYKYMLI